MESEDKDKQILQAIRAKGPLLPVHIVKEIGWNTILVGAALSDLSRKGHIKISHTKIGGSPVYYVVGQEYKLQDLYKQLHEKEQKAYNMLKEKKILKDRGLEPVIRVALRNIKDFAKPLEVTINNESEIFWKWYLTSNAEASEIIKGMIRPAKKEEKEIKKKELKEVKEEPKETKQESGEVKQEVKKEERQEILEKGQEIEEKSPFLNKIRNYFAKNQIEILEQKIIRKTNDAEFVIKVPTNIGSARYFCKARAKKRFSDSDLSNVYVQGEIKKLPVLFLITGELTKKAQILLDEQFKNMNIKKI